MTYVYIKMESSLRRCFAQLIICLITSVGCLLSAAAETERGRLEEIGDGFSEVLKYTDAKMWSKATEKVDTLNNSVAYDILQWLKLRDGTKDFSNYESFLMLNDDWPGINLLRSKGEFAIDSSISSSRVLKYFGSRKPMTAAGALRFSEALLLRQDVRGAEEVIKQSWLEHSYSTEEITVALKLFGPFLEAYHVLRTDNLLWFGQFKDAELMIPFLSKDDAMLVTTRIALQKKKFWGR
jgi:soluble lytic murein transglycosylase